MARIINDNNKKTDFINQIVKSSIPNQKKPVDLKLKFERIVDRLDKNYNKELKNEEKNFEKLKSTKKYKDLTDGITDMMYVRGKTRKFNYSTVPQSNEENSKTKIQNLYKSGNVNSDVNTFNGKIQFN